MDKIAIVVDGEWEYPIYRDNGKYYIDMGGAMGMSEPLDYPSDTKAIAHLQSVIESDPWNC